MSTAVCNLLAPDIQHPQRPADLVIPWRSHPVTHPLDACDSQMITRLQQLLPTTWFFLFTVVFKNGYGLHPATIKKHYRSLHFNPDCNPRSEHFKSFFTTVIYRKLNQLAGCIEGRGSLVIDVHEHEHGAILGASPSCPDHIHCLLGVPHGCNRQRLERAIRKALVPGSEHHGQATQSRMIADVKLDELLTATDIEHAYCYIRKRKWHKPVGGE